MSGFRLCNISCTLELSVQFTLLTSKVLHFMLSHPNQVAEDALIALTTRWYLPKLLQRVFDSYQYENAQYLLKHGRLGSEVIAAVSNR